MNTRFFWKFISLISATAGLSSIVAAAPLTLVQENSSNYSIVVPIDAIPSEKNAARQLQTYLKQVTDTNLPIRTENETDAKSPQILVGTGQRVKSLLPNQNWPALESDGIVIKTTGNKLILAGGRPRGALYAVFQFLEDNVGCRWWTPTENFIPRKSSLTVPDTDVVYVPPFKYREHFTSTAQLDPFFATTLRENGHSQPQDEAWGGHYHILGWSHTFSQLLPPEKYFKEHPDWYSDPANGDLPCTSTSAMPHETQLCVTNPEVQAELSKQALVWIAKEPEAGYISISENDGKHYCRCPRCLKAVEEEGSQAGPNLKLVNAVASDIAKVYPNFLVETLAYNDTQTPPKTVKAAPNVIVRLAPIYSDYGHPLDSDYNGRTRDNFKQWSAISHRLFAWNYVTNFNYAMMPHPNWEGLAKDLRFFAATNVQGVFEHGDAYTNGVGDFVQLRTWVTGKLMWNPNLNQDQLIDEFLKGYYGPAALYLRNYIDALQRSFLKSNRALSTFNDDFAFIDLYSANELTEYFNYAADAVKNDPVLAARVRREQLSLDLFWLYRHKPLAKTALRLDSEYLGPGDPQQSFQQFIGTAQGYGVRDFRERGSFVKEIPVLQRLVQPTAPLPEGIPDASDADVTEIEPTMFKLLGGAGVSELVPDASAVYGNAVYISGSTRDWLIQAPLDRVLDATEQSKWQVYIVARSIARPGAAPEGTALQLGIHDEANKATVFVRSVPLNQLSGGGYRVVDCGTYTLNTGMYLWLAGPGWEGVDKTLIERVIFVRQPA